ncbi:MAG: hypothetical protein HY902_13280 [Deltaproteobacteria bacterium]|nr:hypothetical protein [Deltaproteobacteria bacterium]
MSAIFDCNQVVFMQFSGGRWYYAGYLRDTAHAMAGVTGGCRQDWTILNSFDPQLLRKTMFRAASQNDIDSVDRAALTVGSFAVTTVSGDVTGVAIADVEDTDWLRNYPLVATLFQAARQLPRTPREPGEPTREISPNFKTFNPSEALRRALKVVDLPALSPTATAEFWVCDTFSMARGDLAVVQKPADPPARPCPMNARFTIIVGC